MCLLCYTDAGTLLLSALQARCDCELGRSVEDLSALVKHLLQDMLNGLYAE